MCNVVGKLLDACGVGAALKALFDKHAEVGFDSEQRERMQMTQDPTGMMTGLDLSDEDSVDADAFAEFDFDFEPF